MGKTTEDWLRNIMLVPSFEKLTYTLTEAKHVQPPIDSNPEELEYYMLRLQDFEKA